MIKKILITLALKILNKYMFYSNREVQSVKDILTTHVFNHLTSAMPTVRMVNLQEGHHINKLLFDIELSNANHLSLSIENIGNQHLEINLESTDIKDIFFLSDLLGKITPPLKANERAILGYMFIMAKNKSGGNNIPTVFL